MAASRRSRARTQAASLAALVLLALLGALQQWSSESAPADDAALAEAVRERRSGVVLETRGFVQRTLADDLKGSRHQRFIVEVTGGRTLLVAHNIDLAPRVPLSRGDEVELRGQYEWNERGGVLHWTHHDPGGDRPGGWIRHAERVYR